MKIALIMPGRGQIVFDKGGKPWLPPSSLLEVAGMTPENHAVILWDELAQGYLNEKNLPEAALYGIGGLSTSRYGAYRVAELLHRHHKTVIAGGMDVTGHFKEGFGRELLEHYDAIVPGRLTSKLWTKILDDFEHRCLGKVYAVEKNEPWEFAIPRRELIKKKNYFLPSTLRVSAGCNEACPFCTVGLIIGGARIVFVKPRIVLQKEMEQLSAKELTVVYDDSFGANYEYTMEVAIPLLEGREWFTEITIKNLVGDGRRRGLIEPMAKAGCKGVYIGIENIDRRVSGKSLNIEAMEEAIKRCHDAGFLVMGSLILDVTGYETETSIKKTVEWVIRNKLDFVQYSLLALLPGSVSRERALKEGRMIDNNPEHLDGAWPTIAHPILSPADRIELLQWAYRETYSATGIFQRSLRKNLSLKWRAIAAAANAQVNRSLKEWEKVGTVEHWYKTREDVSQSACV